MAVSRIRISGLIERIVQTEIRRSNGLSSLEEEAKRTIPPKFIVEDLSGNELGRTLLFEDAVDLYMKRYPYVKDRKAAHPFITKIEE